MTRLTLAFASIGAAGLLAACGDNLHPGGTPIDGPEVPPIDAPIDGPTATVGATVAVTDVSLTDPAAATVGGIRGGSIAISFSDLTMDGGDPIFGTTPIGACLITKFNSTNRPNPLLDAGTITITDDSVTADSGLLKTVGPCNFVGAANDYLCISAAGATQTIAATDPSAQPAGVIAYTNVTSATTLNAQKLVGSALQVNGTFATAGFNSGASAFPIINQNPTNGTLVVFNPAGEAATDDTPDTAVDATFAVLNGRSPVPAAGAAADFLGAQPGAPTDPSDGRINISKPANAVWPAIDQTVYTRGDGLDLDDASNLPHAFPFATPAALSFTCAGAGGNCGGEASDVGLEAMILSGRATKQDVSALAPFQMPTENPADDEWLEWQCAYIAGQSATMPLEAVQAIVDFAPTRVEMRVLRVAGALINEGPNTMRLLVGHGLVGHTDPPPPAAN